MAKIRLEFDPWEDRLEMKRAVAATDLALCLWDMREHLRCMSKFEQDEAQQRAYEEMQTHFCCILDKHGIYLDDILE